MLLEFCDAKQLCIAHKWFRNADKKKITYGSGCNESEVGFSIVGNVDGRCCLNYPGEQCLLVLSPKSYIIKS